MVASGFVRESWGLCPVRWSLTPGVTGYPVTPAAPAALVAQQLAVLEKTDDNAASLRAAMEKRKRTS